MLNQSSETGYTCLIPALRGNAFTTENVCCGFVIYALYYTEIGSLYAHFLESFFFFIING